MFKFKEFIKPNPIKRIIFFILFLFAPVYWSLSSAFIDEFGLSIIDSIIFPSMIFEFPPIPIIQLTFQLIAIFIFSFLVGEIIYKKISHTFYMLVIQKALAWTFGTLATGYFLSTLMGSGSIYWSWVLIDLFKYAILLFILSLIVEIGINKIKNKIIKSVIFILFVLILILIAFFVLKIGLLEITAQ